MLKLEAFRRLQAMSPQTRNELRGVLLDLRAEAKVNGEKCWATSKYMMAAYWRVMGVYAGHIARALRTRGAA